MDVYLGFETHVEHPVGFVQDEVSASLEIGDTTCGSQKRDREWLGEIYQLLGRNSNILTI